MGQNDLMWWVKFMGDLIFVVQWQNLHVRRFILCGVSEGSLILNFEILLTLFFSDLRRMVGAFSFPLLLFSITLDLSIFFPEYPILVCSWMFLFEGLEAGLISTVSGL